VHLALIQFGFVGCRDGMMSELIAGLEHDVMTVVADGLDRINVTFLGC